MSVSPFATESNAICRPSGDQFGLPELGPPKEVTCLGFEPSLLHTHISIVAERSDWKTIRLPSGDIFASMSCRDEQSRQVDGFFRPAAKIGRSAPIAESCSSIRCMLVLGL